MENEGRVRKQTSFAPQQLHDEKEPAGDSPAAANGMLPGPQTDTGVETQPQDNQDHQTVAGKLVLPSDGGDATPQASAGPVRELPNTFSIHGEQAAKRRAIAELIFFAGVNDLNRCKQMCKTWNINVSRVR